MSDGYVTYSTLITLTPEQVDIIEDYAVDLQIPFDDILRLLVCTAVRYHFERAGLCVDPVAPELLDEEVSGDGC